MSVILMPTVVTLLVATTAFVSVDLRAMVSTVLVRFCLLIGREGVIISYYITNVHRYQ